MQSHLTRQVFRQILQNEPITHLQCYSRSILRRYRRQQPTLRLSKTSSRPLFGFSRKPPRELKPTDLDQGHEQLIELCNLLAIKARPPPAHKITKAFRDFFYAKADSKSPLEDHQFQHAITAFKHLQTHTGDGSAELTAEDLQTALKALTRRKPQQRPESRAELSRLLFEELRLREEKTSSNNDSIVYERLVLAPYVRILSQSGNTGKARELVEDHWKRSLKKDSVTLWYHLLRGFARESKEEEILRTIDLMRANEVAFDVDAHQALTLAYIRLGDLASTKRWYLQPIDNGATPSARLNVMVLKLCINEKDFQWGQGIFTKILDQNLDKDAWDVIFQWASAKGKGVDEVERMMKVMIETTAKSGNTIRPDIYTINELIDLANKMHDSYTAERYVALAHKWKIALNAQTWLLQLDYRINIGDLDGARHAYKDLQSYEVSGDKDVPFVNKLILALCSAKTQDYDAIMGLVEDLTERKARFDPATVSALCLLHLRRKELHDVIDLLQTHAFHYDIEERASVRDTFVDFCLDRDNSTALAWDAYTISRQIFTETERGTRTKLMNEFFARKRSDMATHVFGHMRQSPFPQKRPTADTYAQCLEGIAQQADTNSMEIVHNMLKLDSEVEPDTRLHNALMMAYSACGQYDRSLDFWDDIVYSREGPTYDSIRIALRACQLTPFGERRARDIWRRLQRFEIEINKEIYENYVAALAGQGLIVESAELLDKMEQEVGHKPDAVSLGVCYNASPGSVKKAQVEEWIKANYPSIWDELESMGRMRPRGRDEIFNVDSVARDAALASEAALKVDPEDDEEDEVEKWI
ncbi:hypothetical protein MMC26_001066 [Xylographa opegraphella]|nr:hypothetical protein [Xylographa opegraphella]